MMSYSLTGTVKKISQTITYPSGFSKRDFVVTTDEKYPQDILFEVVKDKISLLDPLTPGEQVKVQFEIRGREHNGRFYVNLNAWRVDVDEPRPETQSQIPGNKELDTEASYPWDDEEPPF